jgi:hypothetical protein
MDCWTKRDHIHIRIIRSHIPTFQTRDTTLGLFCFSYIGTTHLKFLRLHWSPSRIPENLHHNPSKAERKALAKSNLDVSTEERVKHCTTSFLFQNHFRYC